VAHGPRQRIGLEPTTVVVNGAEGEPGTFKDRTICRSTLRGDRGR
jgi:NADH:ubiquinone oxidoreductase subunit F (NADH-binding)